jgi:hypothetical protein
MKPSKPNYGKDHRVRTVDEFYFKYIWLILGAPTNNSTSDPTRLEEQYSP